MLASRRVIRRALAADAKRGAAAESSCTGAFGWLADDVLLLLFSTVLAHNSEGVGLSHVQQAACASRALLALAAACKRTATLLAAAGRELKLEALARQSTTITPVRGGPLAFTAQLRAEGNSEKQLKLIRSASRSMVLHCAKAGCCGRMQKAFNRDQERSCAAGRVAAAMQTCSLLTASRDGGVVFAYARRRLSKLAVHGEERGRRFEDVLIQAKDDAAGGVATTAVALVSLDDCSEPLSMRCDSAGSVVAYVSAKHGTTYLSEPFSKLDVWQPGGFGPVQLPRGRCCKSVQDAWFLEAGGDTLLAAALSVGYVHPSGHETSNLDLEDAAYTFCTYSIGDGELETDTCGDTKEQRSLLGCSPTARGNKVLALAQCRRGCGAPPAHAGIRRAYVCDLDNDAEQLVSLASPGGADSLVCASLSPSGDAVVALNATGNAYTLEVLVCGSDLNFTPVQKVAMSPYLALFPGNRAMSDLVKSCFRIEMSPCGRFTTVVDRRPLFGDPSGNYAAVVVDMRNRMSTGKLRALPLFNNEDQAPRDMIWTETRVWLMAPGTDENGSISPRGGALCLSM